MGDAHHCPPPGVRGCEDGEAEPKRMGQPPLQPPPPGHRPPLLGLPPLRRKGREITSLEHE